MIIYVTRDIERALGIAPSEHFHIITNRTPYSDVIKLQHPKFITLIDPKNDPKSVATESLRIHALLDTAQLLENSTVIGFINEQNKKAKNPLGVGILVFKNTAIIESICNKNSWHLLNPRADLAEKIENKVTQAEWLGDIGERYLVPHKILATKNIVWEKKPLVVQWAHGHTGDGTMLINSAAELVEIQQKFPERITRVSEYINGPSFTLNIVISKDSIFLGNISYQITGLPPFTDNPFSTVGNDWSLTHNLLSEKDVEYISDIAKEVANKMRNDGWVGMCGIDVIFDNERNKINLIEINARQPAGTTYESQLQQRHQKEGIAGSTIFEAYINALSGKEILMPIIILNDGAQIIQRMNTNIKTLDDSVTGSLKLSGYETILYENIETNSDLLRIQSLKGIMESHGKFNSRGKEIVEAVEKK